MSDAALRRPGAVAVVGVSLAALAAGTFSIVGLGVLAPELKVDLGLSTAEVGFLTSLVFIGSMITSRRAGRLTDAVGPARVLGFSLAAAAASLALAAVAPSTPLFMAGVLLMGLAYGGVNPPTNVVVAGRLGRRLGFFLSIKQSGVPVGGLLAGLVLPPIAIAYGWRWALVAAVCLLAAVAVSARLLRNAAVLDPAGSAGGRVHFPRRELLGMGVFGFVMSGTQWTFLIYLTLYLTGEPGFSLQLAGIALGLAQGLGAGGRLLWGWLSDHPGRRLPILVSVAGVSAVLLGLLASGLGEPMLWLVIAATGLVLVGWNGAYHALVADRAGPGRIGRASGEALVFIFGGSVVLPPLLGLLADSTDSFAPLWGTTAGLVAVAGITLWGSLRGTRLLAVAGGATRSGVSEPPAS
jgi:MFS family permease